MKTIHALPVLIFTLTLVAVSQNPVPTSNRKALIIGNGNYVLLPKIPITERNASKMEEALKSVGFTPWLRPNLDQAGILRETKAFLDTVQPGDIVFFYYSGYGLQSNDSNVLLPVNFDPKSDERILNQAYDIQVLISDLDQKKPESRIIVIDASRQAQALSALTPNEGLARVDQVDPGTLIAFSAQPGNLTLDREGEDIGVFTQSLADALRMPGSKPVTVFDFVQRDVRAKTGQVQIPYYLSSAPGDFYFSPPLPVPPPKPVIVLPSVGTTRENPSDGLGYVWIPAGKFQMGCVPADTECRPDESPRHAVAISTGFWMAKTEITLSAYERFTLATRRPSPKNTQTNRNGMLTEHPVTKVSIEDATDYCKWAGGNLPTEAEWEYAARGGVEDQVYPWGNGFDPEAANSHKRSQRKGRFQETVPVRRYPANPFGLFDMAGNVREWTRDFYHADAYAKLAGAEKDPEERRPSKEWVARGGSFNEAEKDFRLSARDHPPVASDNQTGFRCTVPVLN